MSEEKNLLQKNIFEVMGLQNLPMEEQAKLLDRMTDLVMKRLMLRAIEEIKPEDAQEAERIFAAGTDEEKVNFLKEKMDFARLMEEETLKLKEEMAEEMKKGEV